MKKVFLFSILLIVGFIGSQYLDLLFQGTQLAFANATIRLLTMFCLGFIMIHVGYEFEINKKKLKSYAIDYGVAATAAAFPWIFVSLYLVFIFYPQTEWTTGLTWTEALLAGRFAAPTSAGILFSMLAAAGLASTWYFKKIRLLAIFDDLDTVLFMIPLKMLLVGFHWQLGVVVILMSAMIWLAWRYLHLWKIPVSWPWVMTYAGVITLVSELIYEYSKLLNDTVPIHLEVLLPAFALGCMLAHPKGSNPHSDDSREGHQEGPESSSPV